MEIYQPQTGTLNISGGSITGWGGVEVKGGTVTISGGNITAAGKKGQYEDYNMGTSSVGYAVAVVEDNDYKGSTVTIDGGTFKGGVAILKSGKEDVYNSATVNIKSGVFNDENLYANLTGDVCKSKVAESGAYTVAQSHKYDTTVTTVTKEPTCTETGVEKVFCTVCGIEGEEYTREVSALGHDYSVWQSDATSHWLKCSRCDAVTEKENHTDNSKCVTCGYGCKHNNVKQYDSKAASCVTEGYESYIVCIDCGKHVVKSDSDDATATYTVTSDSPVTIPKLDHNYSYEYTSSQHWQVCSECGDTTAKLDHEYSGRTCTVCDYVKPRSSGGSSSGGSGSSGTTTYKVTTSAVSNGSVKTSVSAAAKGATVTLTLSPDKGYTLDKLTVTDASGNSISTTKKSDTVYTFTMPASQVKVSVTYVKEDSTVVEPTTSFADVTSTDWFAEAVKYVADKGMMNGTSKTTFGPKSGTTRGMIVTVLYRLENEPSTSATSFTDVASDAYYANAVAWANANSVVSGYGNGKFGPNDSITREQLAAILYRYAQYKKYNVSVGEDTNIMDFDDVRQISSYAVPAIQWACGAGVMTGKSTTTLDPKGGATRAEVAAMLMRFCENVK